MMRSIHRFIDKLAEFKFKRWWFWQVLPGPTVLVKWPSGKLIIVNDEHPDWDWTLGATKQETWSSDPNDFYRDWLQENVGKQLRDWDWMISEFGAIDTDFGLIIKLRKSKSQYASIIALKWG